MPLLIRMNETKMMQTDTRRYTVPGLATLLAILLAFLAGCAATPQGSVDAAASAPTDPGYEIEPWDGDGMDIPLDGSSLEAFERSLARVKAHTSEVNYVTLTNAIDYLLFYELAVKRDRELLAANLDGLNGHEVIARVELIRQGGMPKPRFHQEPGETEA